MQRHAAILLIACLLLAKGLAHAGDPPKFRTDDNADRNLPWYRPVAGEFPPANSAHYISGELIGIDHIERGLVLRVDRDDSQNAGYFDLPLHASMLPYGSIYYHGAPAALKDIPLGTHMHGWFYDRPDDAGRLWKDGRRTDVLFNQRVSNEADFTQCFRLEDDFTYYASRQQAWKIDTVDLAAMKLTATLQHDGKPIGKASAFDLRDSTIVFEGNGFGTLKSIKPGQMVQLNVTWATLYGPGRVVQIWLDEQSRSLATAHQLARHRDHIRERGYPGWVAAVDDEKRVVTITFFDSIDPDLFKDLTSTNPEPLGWPTSEYDKGNLSPKGNIVVARESLMTYEPVNDRKGGNILRIGEVPVRPGCSGVQIDVQCGILLEGFRPGKIVRFYPATWPVIALPKEESFYGRE
ncbi:MAG: hypothetical protein GC159_12785 [Phycisphaera sp.]|nr:hypothetical protein [Phycisphaera sp.]